MLSKNSKEVIHEIGFSPELIQRGIEVLRARTNGQTVSEEGGQIALGYLASAERTIAARIHALNTPVPAIALPADAWAGLTPDVSQLEAVERALASKVFIISGGPGVGKTTSCKAMVEAYKDAGLSVVGCAPTGRAATRLGEQTGLHSQTIHRLCGLFSAEPKPIDAGVCLIDESSMVDVTLFARFLELLSDRTRLVVIGDIDQLPSIGPGRILYDLLTSGVIKVARLTKIFRQASESAIPWLARAINEGRMPDDELLNSNDTTFIDQEIDIDVQKSVIAAALEHGDAAQVLSSQRNGAFGVNALNTELQKACNAYARMGAASVPIGRDAVAFCGDKVIHVKNNYDLETMNGEIGRIVQTGHENVVQFLQEHPETYTSISGAARRRGEEVDTHDVSKQKYAHVVVYGRNGNQRFVAYTAQEARDETELGYALTVHKAQGSGFPVTIYPVHKNHGFMLTRNILYTAATRAEKKLVLVGQRSQLARSARNVRGVLRRTRLTRLLVEPRAEFAAPEVTDDETRRITDVENRLVLDE